MNHKNQNQIEMHVSHIKFIPEPHSVEGYIKFLEDVDNSYKSPYQSGKSQYQSENSPYQSENSPYQSGKSQYQSENLPYQSRNSPYQLSNSPYQSRNSPYQQDIYNQLPIITRSLVNKQIYDKIVFYPGKSPRDDMLYLSEEMTYLGIEPS